MVSTRRAFLGGVLGAAGAAALTGLDPFSGKAYALPVPSTAGTTLAQTIVRGAAGAGGYTTLTSGPGEPYILQGRTGRAHDPPAGRWPRPGLLRPAHGHP